MAGMNEIREVDRARAAQLVAAQLTGDAVMFGAVLDEIAGEQYGLAGVGGWINALRMLSEDLAHAIREQHGDQSAELVRVVIAQHRAAAEKEAAG